MLATVVAFAVLSVGLLVGVLMGGYKPLLGLDLEGGASVVYTPAHHAPNDVINQAISIIRNRVDALGVAQPNIARQGDNIVVQLPGVKDPHKALALIGRTAQLRFRPVLCLAPPYTAPKGKKAPTPTGPPPPCSAQYAETATNSNPSPDPTLAAVPSTPASLDKPGSTVLLPEKNAQGQVTGRYEMGPSPLSGTALKTAAAGIDQSGKWQVNFTLTSAGSPKWDAITQANFHKQVAVVLDGVVKSAPIIQPDQAAWSSFAGRGQISGSFTQASANDLALVLRYGALPVQLKQQTVQTVSPTLGKSSLHAGLIAGLAGMVLVLIYMIFYYRALGFVVLIGLVLTAALLWAIVSLLGTTSGLALDLSGVTGLIVSVGITVDSYIVYFERLKDDLRSGRSLRTAVDRSFARAFRTVLAADAVSFIGALLLYLLTVGQVRGFAFFLGLSTLLDVFTAYFYNRPIVVLLGRSRLFTEARWFGVAPGLALPGEPEPESPEPVPAGARP